MNVLSYISTLIILGLGLLYLVVNSNFNECPHPNFKFKHWCENCSNENEAYDFTVAHRILIPEEIQFLLDLIFNLKLKMVNVKIQI